MFEAAPAPPPVVTEYRVVAKQCPGCGAVTEGMTPAEVTSLVQYGPGVHARAALAVCAHHLPVARAAKLVAALTGVNVSAGFVAGVRGRRRPGSARSRTGSGRCCAPLGVLYADETPARAAGDLRYVHVACTEFLTAMHTGGRSAKDIDAGGVLPGYTGTIVRDGYAGCVHLSDAVHAWCGAPSKSSSAPPADAGAPCKASPTSRSSSPTSPPPAWQMGNRPARRAHPTAHHRPMATSRHPPRLNSYGLPRIVERSGGRRRVRADNRVAPGSRLAQAQGADQKYPGDPGAIGRRATPRRPRCPIPGACGCGS